MVVSRKDKKSNLLYPVIVTESLDLLMLSVQIKTTPHPQKFQIQQIFFCSELHGVFALSYLDDIIILSPTFQKHLYDLEQMFKHLSLFKLHANREKRHLCCEKVN